MISFSVLCAAYVLSQFYRAFLAVVAGRLTQELAFGPAELGALSAMFFGAFAVAQFPIGWALDTFGARRTVGGFMLAAIAGALLFAIGSSFLAMMTAMALIGVGCAPVLMGSLYVFGRAYPPERFAMLASLMIGISALGNLLAATPMAYAVELFGWRASMAGIAALTAASRALVFLLLADPPAPAASASAPKESPLAALRTILALKPLWLLFPLTFIGYGVVAAERSLWIGPYLGDVHGLDPIARGNGILAMAVAMSVGAFAYGPVERWLRGPKPAVLAGNVIAGTAFVILGVTADLATGAAIAALAIAGGFGMTYALLMAHARQFFPDRLLGRGVTLLNFVFISGAGLIQAVSGLFVRDALAAGQSPAASYAALHLAFGAALLVGTAIYAATPARPR
jgi:predicted MFS family arabinose efflux permease